MPILRTERLLLREATPDDADFVVALVNEPGWRRHINQPDVHDRATALAWMESRLFTPYREQGHGFWLIERLRDGALLGLCGLFRRPVLDGPDLGYALLARYEGQGYAHEAALGCIEHARSVFGWSELLAITSPGNVRSEALLTRLGFRDEGPRQLAGYGGPSNCWRLRL